MITKLDFVVSSLDRAERSRRFYVETLDCGRQPRKYEFWVGDTCFGIWEPSRSA